VHAFGPPAFNPAFLRASNLKTQAVSAPAQDWIKKRHVKLQKIRVWAANRPRTVSLQARSAAECAPRFQESAATDLRKSRRLPHYHQRVQASGSIATRGMG
jgi:hypothetical protein